mmetsp:Transcript_34037/g.60190  ORF Transcript_34037/g.60190 Transcript_34037/m.60190 type:complete len:323 (+) Transcript_34037:130-1098(+)
MAGAAAVQRIAFTPTRHQLPQSFARTPGHDSYITTSEHRGYMESSPASDGSDLQVKKKMSLHLPSSKAARNVAGKASKAATKGATKMASAFKKLGRKGTKRLSALEDPEIIGAVEESADLLALEGVIDGVLDTNCDLDSTWEKVPSSGEAAGMQRCRTHSPRSTPSTDRPGSPERQERSDFSSSSEPHNTSGSDSDAGHNRASARETKAPVRDSLRPERAVDVWDAQAYGKVRPLKCQSIWDIPTSRIPEPPPRAPAPRVSSAQAQARSLPQIKISVARDPESGLAEAGVSRSRCRHKHRIALLLCLAAVLLCLALAAALSL